MIATGEEDPERGRNTVYVRIHALWELLGTDADHYRNRHCPQVESPAGDVRSTAGPQGSPRRRRRRPRKGALTLATPALMRALNLVCGEVPFPGLYEDFFEAAREDFENLVRNTLLRVAADLLREGDVESAERVLRQGYEATSDDEEIAERFCEALIGRGRRAEAERVRRGICR